MKAILLTAAGGPEVLKVTEVEISLIEEGHTSDKIVLLIA